MSLWVGELAGILTGASFVLQTVSKRVQNFRSDKFHGKVHKRGTAPGSAQEVKNTVILGVLRSFTVWISTVQLSIRHKVGIAEMVLA